MRISRLHLKNIGVFEDEEIIFREKTDPEKAEIHILTGENGTGKSTVLYALAGIIPQDCLLLRFRFSDEKSNYRIEFDNDEAISYECNDHHPLGKKKSKVLTEYLKNHEHYQHSNFSFVFFAYSGYRSTNSYEVKSIQELANNPFEKALDFDNSINPLVLMQWIANNKTKEALELVKGDLEKANRYRNSIRRIEQAVSSIIDKEVEFILETDPLNVVLKLEGQLLIFDVLPDGLKSIISWIADLLMRMDRIRWATDVAVLDRNFILFLDEIEVHLHPAWQRKILPEIQKLFKNAQIFISTHSPFVVGSVDDAWVYKLELKDGHSNVTDVRLSKAGNSYQLILDEVFGIESEFAESVEKEFEVFYAIKNEILQKNFSRVDQLLELSKNLASKSIEVRDIVGRELRQLQRVTGKDFTLVYE